jgi:DNA-damage-inducible protein D
MTGTTMKNALQHNQSLFEQIKETDENGNEYWGARKLAKVLEYREFRNFTPVIEKAKEACKNSEQQINDHFVDFHEVISHGKGAEQSHSSIKLSRYACYLIVQNADPNKEVVALGQTYFAVQTRIAGNPAKWRPTPDSVQKMKNGLLSAQTNSKNTTSN